MDDVQVSGYTPVRMKVTRAAIQRAICGINDFRFFARGGSIANGGNATAVR